MKPVVPFWVAILATVVGLLIVTGGFLIFYDLHWGQRSIELLKAYYLDQVADTAEKEVARLARIGVQALLAQRYRFATGSYSTDDSIALARTLAAVLPADPDIEAITFREGATGRVMSATRVGGKELVLTVSDPRIDGGIPQQFRADTLAPLLHAAPPAGLSAVTDTAAPSPSRRRSSGFRTIPRLAWRSGSRPPSPCGTRAGE
jgi:hypothetical protein